MAVNKVKLRHFNVVLSLTGLYTGDVFLGYFLHFRSEKYIS